jgi:hypothetical protein
MQNCWKYENYTQMVHTNIKILGKEMTAMKFSCYTVFKYCLKDCTTYVLPPSLVEIIANPSVFSLKLVFI